MTILQLALRRPTECRFQRETIDQAEFFPHDDAGRALTRFLHLEIAGIKLEIFVVFVEQIRENPLLKPVCFRVGTSIHE